MSETHNQRLNVRDWMLETQCKSLNVKVWFTNLVTCCCCTLHLSVQSDICVQRNSGFVALSFASLTCCKAFSECEWATHSINVVGRLHQHRGTDYICGVRNTCRPSLHKSRWCHNDGFSAALRVFGWKWGSLSSNEGCQVNVDWSERIDQGCICYLPTSTTWALTHAIRDVHPNTNYYRDANTQADLVKKVAQIELSRVWRSKMPVFETGQNR